APISFACAFAASMLTSSSATFAPAFASSAAVAAPRPEPPPVTIAACPLMSMFVPPKILVCRFRVLDPDCNPYAEIGRRDLRQSAVIIDEPRPHAVEQPHVLPRCGERLAHGLPLIDGDDAG